MKRSYWFSTGDEYVLDEPNMCGLDEFILRSEYEEDLKLVEKASMRNFIVYQTEWKHRIDTLITDRDVSINQAHLWEQRADRLQVERDEALARATKLSDLGLANLKEFAQELDSLVNTNRALESDRDALLAALTYIKSTPRYPGYDAAQDEATSAILAHEAAAAAGCQAAWAGKL